MELELINWFQELFKSNYSFFDRFWLFISFFGTEIFIIALVATTYWTVDKKQGEFLALSGLSSAMINGGIKDLVKRERPYSSGKVRSVESAVDDIKLSHSFPSGHSQNSATLFASLFIYLKKRWILIVGIIITILVGLSRIYLGVHYPSDVLLGLIFGITITIILYYFYKKYYEKRIYIYLILAIIAIITLFIAKSKDTYVGIGALIGSLAGLLFEQKLVSFEIRGSLLNRIIKIIVGLALLFALKEGLNALFILISDNENAGNILSMLRYFILTFIGLAIYPLVFKKIEDRIDSQKKLKKR